LNRNDELRLNDTGNFLTVNFNSPFRELKHAGFVSEPSPFVCFANCSDCMIRAKVRLHIMCEPFSPSETKTPVFPDEAQRKYDFSSYRQDLPGFGEPALGVWDGFMRVNTDTGAGGLVAVFRENARETTRRVFVPDLTPTREYAVKLAPEGRVLHTLTGRQLAEEGFPVKLERAHDGAVFEIERR
jgi:hypothetical protein